MIIFLDTEFTDFGYAMSLISIGLAAQDGRTFYGERNDFNRALCNDFVRKVVLPQLGKKPECIYTHSGFADAVLEWLQPYKDLNPVIGYDYSGDRDLFAKLLGHQYPEWLTCMNVYPQIDDLAVEQFFVETGLQDHHALNDARANMAAYRLQEVDK